MQIKKLSELIESKPDPELVPVFDKCLDRTGRWQTPSMTPNSYKNVLELTSNFLGDSNVVFGAYNNDISRLAIYRGRYEVKKIR